MDRKAAIRLRILGVVVLILFFMFAIPFHSALAVSGEAYQSALATTLAFGIGLLLFAEIGPLVKSMKAGGVELEFVDTLSTKFNEIEKRLAQLELAAARPDLASRETQTDHKPVPVPMPMPAPALKREKRRQDDQWKGRFGGESERDGFKMEAEFRSAGRDLVEVFLKVTAPPDAAKDLACVEFYLHQTFDPEIIPAVFHDGKAQLSVIAYGGFTVGAWIPCVGVELELDLAAIKKAPRIIREL